MITLCDSSGSGGARKGTQHQSAVVGTQQQRTNRSESLDRSHVGLVSGSDACRQQLPRVAGYDVPLLPSHISPNLSDSRRHATAAESRLTALKSGQVDCVCSLLCVFSYECC